MDFVSILIIAIGLSADSFAVSVSNGLINNTLKFRNNLFVALSFAFFQALMPLLGYLLGNTFANEIKATDHWIAFTLLSFIGLKMIYESFRKDENQNNKTSINFFIIIAQSVATSIDALIIGISFAFIKVNIYITVFVIGIVTLIFSLSGFCIGKKYGNKFSKYAELTGGIILILLGVKILIEHIYFQ